MASRIWNGLIGDFENKDDWSGGVVPVIGDVVTVAAGAVILRRSTQPQATSYDGLAFTLGSASGPAAELRLDGATLGGRVSVTSDASAPDAAVTSVGASGFQGYIDAAARGGSFTIGATVTDTTQPADFVLLDGGRVMVENGDALIENGRFDNHGAVTIQGGSSLAVNGVLDTLSGTLDVQTGASIGGAGTLGIGMNGSVYLHNFSSTTATFRFDGPGGLLRLGAGRSFNYSVTNFQAGDVIAFDNNEFGGAAVDYADFEGGFLTLRSGGAAGAVEAKLNVTGPAASGVAPISTGGEFQYLFIGASGTFDSPATALAATTVGASDHALRADAARAADRMPGGAPIDGSGVRIGILSDSFNTYGYNAPDQDAQAGFLPLRADGKTCAVTVLKDAPGGYSDEGRAMAQLVHRIAPGAQIDFYTGDTADDFAAGVKALADAGCNVIVDDLSLKSSSGALGEPFFQIAGPADAAVEAAVARGVNYFTAAGNEGSDAFQGVFSASHAATTLRDGSAADAFVFGNGTPYQTIRGILGGSVTLSMQWDAPVADGTASPPQELSIKVFSASGALVAASATTRVVEGSSGITLPGQDVTFNVDAGQDYQVAICRPGGAPLAGTFKYILTDGGSGQYTRAAVIADPAANQAAGTVVGHQLLPDVNAVAAIDFADTPSYGGPSGFIDDYSSTGPGLLLFDSSGNRLATPRTADKPDFTAPVGASTSMGNFQPFVGTSAAAPAAAAVSALMLQANPTLSTAQVTQILKASAVSLGEPANVQGAGLIQADSAVALAEAACFAAGARLATPRGPVPVQDLRPGDLVSLAAGGAAPIRWVGMRAIDCASHADPRSVLPVRVKAGAFGPGRPCRDLFLSPDHAVFIDGMLVPVRLLINHDSIACASAAAVTYCHVELDRHAVVLAEGLPTESYLDTGNRALFERAFGAPLDRPGRPAAPLVTDEARLHPIWRRLAGPCPAWPKAAPDPELSLHAAAAPMPRLHVDGRRAVFALRGGAAPLRLRSRATRPSDLRPWSDDRRRLGVAVSEIVVRDEAGVRVLPVDHPSLGEGWWAVERAGARQHRWTDGDAALPPMPRATSVEIRLA